MRKITFALLLLVQQALAQLPATNTQLQVPQKTVSSQVANLQVNPAIAGQIPYFFSQNNIKIVVLMHGITGPKIETAPPTTGYYDRDYNCNTIEHVKAYFTYPFIIKMLGYNGRVTEDPTLERSLGTNSYPRIINLNNVALNSPKDFYINSNVDSDPKQKVYKLVDQNTYVMLIPRDGTVNMMDQAKEAIAEIKKCYDAITTYAKKEGGMYFVCHSGGGIVTRMIMANKLQFDGKTLDETTASFIRNRTVAVTTISTPHEGSPLPAKIISIKQDVGKADAAKTKMLSVFPAPLRAALPFANTNIFTDIVKNLPGFEDRDARDNMSNVDYMPNFNRGGGDPRWAKRSDSTLIPIYCLGGRRPTGPYYNDITQDAYGNIPQYILQRTTSGNTTTVQIKDYSKIQTILGIPAAHLVLHAIDMPSNDQLNWGCVALSDRDSLDRIKWGSKSAQGTFISYNCANSGSTIVPMIYCIQGSDNEVDTDGFVGYNSSVGYTLNTNTKEYFDHKTGGNFYRLYTGPFEIHNHGTIMQSQDVGQYILDNIIKIAGPFPKTNLTVSSWTK
ncbi:MAG: hypothetical protein RLY16_1889 [Bacteroidota bacterium]|jgi:hypothetical protein